MPTFEKNAAKAAALQKLIDHVAERIEAGAVDLIFVEIEQATGVSMRPKPVDGIDGRALLRAAIKHHDLVATSIMNIGYRLSTADTASDVADSRRKRVAKAARRAWRDVESLGRRHRSEFTAAQRDQFSRREALMSTMAALISSHTPASKALPPANGKRGPTG